MPLTINPVDYIIGAADVYYRAVGSSAAWTWVGPTVDDIVFRAPQTMFNPSDRFNGVTGLIREMDYRSDESAEAEFSMPQLNASRLALAIPGATSVTTATTAVAGGGSTTLDLASVVGATNVKVAAVTNFSPGDTAKIGTGASAEYRVIDTVGTALAAGTGLTFRSPLLNAHALGDAVVETVGDGGTEVTSGVVRRQPVGAYNDFLLEAASASSYYRLYLYNAISATASPELTFGDETMASIRVTIAARKNGADLTQPLWKLVLPA